MPTVLEEPIIAARIQQCIIITVHCYALLISF